MTKTQASPVSRLGQFLAHDIWRINVRSLPRRKYVLFRILRILVLAARSFDEDKCQLRASALTYYALLSIVPVFALAFGIAQGFGLEGHLQSIIAQRLRTQGAVVEWIVQFAHSLLRNTQGGVVAGVGIALLFWTVVKLLGSIEDSFNAVWGVKQGRSFGRKLADYLSMMLVAPVLLIVSSSLTVYLTSQLEQISQRIAFVGAVRPLVLVVLNLLPYTIVWALFSFTYIVMPNTKVSFQAGITAGIIAGSIYQLVQWIYVMFQIGVARLSAVYGSFAALPLFLIWLQTSWLVVLLGAEVSFAIDNEETYEHEPESLHTSPRLKRLLALRIVEMSVKRFVRGEPPIHALEVSQQLDAPIRLVRDMLFELVRARVLVQLAPHDGDQEYYQPGQDPDRLTVHAVMAALDQLGHDDVRLAKDRQFEKLSEKLEGIDRLVERSPENVKLEDL